ncbi:MAG TPA: 2-dehydropantoate 2-reductase N-terminal domain-containing protein [Chloroflexota bacterium]|nr:2-dehydropantoate 2-reductase N-terminal domain-containing protein [Chloroflexota bacterium]
MRYIVYGAGAIGSGIGGHLFRTGHDALLVGRPGHVEAIRRHGLRLITPEATHELPVPAVSAAGEIGFREGDVVLLCVKSQDTDRALVELRAAGGDPQTLPIFCCQNSVTNEPAALRYFRRVYGVLIVVPGVFLEDGVVHNPIRGNAGFIEIGTFPQGEDEPSAEVAAALSRASYRATTNARVMAAKGAKMLGNLGNALGAITDGRGDGRAFMGAVRREAEACLAAGGVPFEDRAAFQARTSANRGQTDIPAGLRNLGSSWQSLQRRQGSIEADFLNGEIVRLGRLHGIPTPYNEVLQEVANAMAARRELPGRYTAQDLEAMAESRALTRG